jgi:hypothetical protein
VLIQWQHKMVVLVVLLSVHIQIGEVYLLHLLQLVLAFQALLLAVVVAVVHLHTELLRKHLVAVAVEVTVEQQVQQMLQAVSPTQVLVVEVRLELMQPLRLEELLVQAVQV